MDSSPKKRLLARTLGIEPGDRVRLHGAPEGYDEVMAGGGWPPDVDVLYSPNGLVDVVQVFAHDRETLETALRRAAKEIPEDGAVWACWPDAGSDGQAGSSDLTLESVQATGLDCGLVDVSIEAIDGTWTGVKLVPPRDG